ncbi:DUF3857 domain-containing protein [Mucilaginibacter terrenus]|uniref:DUF3857 domain-containing protein n=1 Tax=Mucilaginibacter terrenus TaxID=2482727 RepID=A0A3E2NWQ5_9SPHI|nr:DUF3857 domain-containing transglutaminase family protein [Mucilaginibacter terrenus]RFZ85290.1 DUF3857 domain-containing protein [Mucilaginibacter terrenus]
MRSAYILLFLLLSAALGYAQPNYDASLISKDLLPYASAVIRNQEVTLEVKDLDNTLYHFKQAITVLNKNGDDIARIVIWHNKSNLLRNVKGVVYNEFGKPTAKFGEKDFKDENAANDYSLFEDSRVQYYTPSAGAYPYTIEYEYETKSKQSLNFDDWKPNYEDGLAVERASYTFTCKPDFKIRYKEVNMPTSASIGSTKEGLKTYTWQLNNLKAIRTEPYSPNPEQYLSSVKIAPQNFKYEGLAGSFSSWGELGKWTYDKLLASRRVLPVETVQRIKEITANITDPKAKAKKIYEFMQGKTRYISVQVGIGGYQPFLASEVDRLSYGDCKALVNYTQALLKAVDIESWYCVVQAGTRKVSMMNDFPSMDQGNHVILCLPFKNDTTFLECTSQKIPFGFLSDFTDDRTVLACTPEGGKLLHTPKYTSAINLQKRKAEFDIAQDGSLKGDIKTTFKGTQYDNVEEMIGEPPSEQIKMLQKEYTAISNLNIGKFDLKQEKGADPVTTETIQVNSREYASADGSKLYFYLNPLNRMQRAPRDVRNRSTQVYINRGYTDEDEIVYNLPEGYKTDKNLLDIAIEKPFGKFTAKTTLSGNKLIYKRRLEIVDGLYNKELYPELVEFYQQVVDADSYNVALVKTD